MAATLQGVSLDHFDERVRLRFDRITSPGVLRYLAGNVATEWKLNRAHAHLNESAYDEAQRRFLSTAIRE